MSPLTLLWALFSREFMFSQPKPPTLWHATRGDTARGSIISGSWVGWLCCVLHHSAQGHGVRDWGATQQQDKYHREMKMFRKLPQYGENGEEEEEEQEPLADAPCLVLGTGRR